MKTFIIGIICCFVLSFIGFFIYFAINDRGCSNYRWEVFMSTLGASFFGTIILGGLAFLFSFIFM